MIQELLGGGVGIGGGSEERKISINGGAVEGSSSTSSSSSENQNLRCPRCDSSNTKFCYYNNYNLTQPRHFCKTCRRYWTKGGALRNVPIGGGCRKNKTASVATATGKSNAAAKAKPILSSENNLVVTGRPSLGNGLDREHLPNPMLWATQQNSHLLALLKAAQNPNPKTSPVMVKEERVAIGSHMGSDSTVMASVLNARNMGLDTLTQAPFGLSNTFWRSNQNHHQQQLPQHNPQQQHNMLLGEVPNTGIQELYQRMRSANNYYNDHSPIAMSNLSSSSSLSSTSSAAASSVLEPASIAGGQLGYWNPAFSWSDLPTTNGAFP